MPIGMLSIGWRTYQSLIDWTIGVTKISNNKVGKTSTMTVLRVMGNYIEKMLQIICSDHHHRK